MSAGPVHPPLDPLRQVVARLADASIEASLGGSGLLMALGLWPTVRDWDLPTDADAADVEPCLRGFTYQTILPSQRFGTQRLFKLDRGGASIDLMCRLSIVTEAGECRIPADGRGTWNGVALATPEAWLVAYRLMERHEKADLLAGYIRRVGADVEVTTGLVARPLPGGVRDELARLATAR